MAPQILRAVDEAARFAESVRTERRRLGLVPTMGFLHPGHLSLMREAKKKADVAVTSIFVNPTQFGPREDFASYPRDLETDLAQCRAAGVDAVFIPGAEEIYPRGYQTFVEVAELSQGLCGARRPGHFRGVSTVVAKLLALFRPHVAVFGEKDYQQLQVIRRLNQDLNLGTEIVGMPTIRDADGLAMSSRNAYLTADERRRALSLSAGLRQAGRLVREGRTDPQELVAAVREALRRADVREDYIEVVEAESLKSIDVVSSTSPARMLVAAFVGKTRLIDNIALNERAA